MNGHHQNMTKMEQIQTDFKDNNQGTKGCKQITDLNNICGFCYSQTETSKTNSIESLIKLVDLKEIMKYLRLDEEHINDIVCEDCFDKLLAIDKFKKQCQTARIKFMEENTCFDTIDVEEIRSIDSEQHSNEEINDTKIEGTKSRHISMFHQCFFCHEIINGIAEFRLHKKSCVVKEVICAVKGCSKSFMTQNGFNTHMSYIHGIIKTSTYTCITCKTNYQMTAIEFQEHVKKCQLNNEYNSQQEIQCDICKFMCNNVESYVSHKMFHDTRNLIQTVDDNGKTLFRKKEKNNFVCDLCGKLFANSRNIRKHKLNVHLVDFDGILFGCDLCGVKKPTKRLLYKHIKSVHIVKPTPCETCGKIYRTRELWQKHSLIHNDLKKNHVCVYCPHKPRFLCKSALQKHMKGCHGECTIGNKYQCDFKNCEASYASEINLNKHKLRVHGYL